MPIALVTPASLLRRDGDSLRPLAQARGLWAAGFRDFTLFSPDPDPSLPYPQQRIPVRGPARFITAPIRGFDLIHAHQNAGLFLPGRVWADLHGFAPLESALAWRQRPLSLRAAAFWALSRWATRRLVRRCERLLCAAPSIAENLRPIFPSRSSFESIESISPVQVLPNCLDPAEYPPTSCASLIVGVIGGFTGRWGAPALAMALQVARACPAVPFRLVGRITPAQRAAATPLPNVEILGEVSESAFKQFLTEISISLLPFPDWCRGGGARQKLLQSAASGLALVATPAGLEGFQSAAAALVGRNPSELARLIQENLSDPAERQNRGQALRRLVSSDYNLYTAGQKLAALYQRSGVPPSGGI